MSYRHLTIVERDGIIRNIGLGYAISEIARIFGRARSTIYRELKRGGECPYDPDRAHEDYLDKRTRCRAERKLASEDMQKYVLGHLKYGWSPEQIEGRDRLEHGTPRVSARTIYRAIADGTLPPSTKDHLAFKGRRRRSHDAERRGKLKGTRSIDERPAIAASRTETGHWEGDTVRGEPGSGAILTLVEMKSRYIEARYLPDGKSDTLARILGLAAEGLKIKTLTVDNGKEFARHGEIEEAAGGRVYFAHPHSPWERASNENANGRLRRWFPKGTDMSQVTDTEVRHAAHRMNFTPRKCLRYRTPFEELFMPAPGGIVDLGLLHLS